MINELLRDLINMNKVTSLIDNVIVETKDKEEHNKLVEKI